MSQAPTPYTPQAMTQMKGKKNNNFPSSYSAKQGRIAWYDVAADPTVCPSGMSSASPSRSGRWRTRVPNSAFQMPALIDPSPASHNSQSSLTPALAPMEVA